MPLLQLAIMPFSYSSTSYSRVWNTKGSKLMTRGIHLTSRIVPGGTHCEASWEKQLPFVFHTLLYEVEE